MPDLPSGIVTLLFTDLAGFTRLGQQLGDRLADQVAEHRRLLRAAYAAHGGHTVNAFGDSTFAVFASAADAVAAAVAAQRAFARHDWPEGAAVQVRIGLHTAELAPVDEGRDYVGPEVDRAALVNAAAHGGQVLLSQATAALVADALPPDTALKDLGDHYLRDYPQPERLWQLTIAGLPADFPPPRARAAGPLNLPVPPTPLVGREREVAAVSALLRAPAARLVTLTGPGGVGKTRLGLLVAAGLADDFRDGVAFVPLAAVSDPALVVPAIAAALGVREVVGQPLAATLAAFLRARRLLLLLDNVEQVLPAAAALADLLAACPAVTLLVTSRAALRIAAEREYVVPPLDLPAPQSALTPDALWRNEAVRLFVERARSVVPAFRATAADAHAIAAICCRLDGLPLAIELAAARSRLLAPPALLARLERRLALLTGGGADLPARQQTLRGTLDWSYLLLGPDDQALFARLAVFVGDWTLEAAEAVCGDSGGRALDVLTGLESLVSKNLVQHSAGVDSAPRLRLLETIREYALERLAASGAQDEASELFRRHAVYYLALAETEPAVRGPAWGAWLARLDQEYDNVRAALGWALDAGETALLLRFGVALRRFWHARGEVSQGRRWLAAALAGDDVPAAELRARAIHTLANLAHYQGDYQQAQALYAESLRLRRAIGDQSGIAGSLASLAEVHQNQGNYAGTRALHEEALAIWRALGDVRGIGGSLAELGTLACRQGEFPRAAALLEEGLALARRAGDAWLAGRCLAELSAVA
ncbi:MAG: ATP-binding protein, partial [Thermomicrobiales bacterium]